MDAHVRDLIILFAIALLFVVTLYVLSLRVARQRELEAQLDEADAEIASLRALLSDATRPPAQFARMRMREVAIHRFEKLRLAAPPQTGTADPDGIRDRIA